MISSDDELDAYPLFNDSACDTGWLDATHTTVPPSVLSTADDTGCSGIASEFFDSTAFLCNSISDDIANYNFLEPLMPISMLDDSGNTESEQTVSSTQVETLCNSSCRTSYTFDPVSLSIVRCVVSSSNQVSSSEPSTSAASHPADSSVSSAAQNVAHNQSRQLSAILDDELDTLDITRRVSEELRRCNISQAVFAQAVLGRSQGTLSDLLRKPKPWAQLKSGRETFAKMRQWLMEPEKQRLAHLSAYAAAGTGLLYAAKLLQ